MRKESKKSRTEKLDSINESLIKKYFETDDIEEKKEIEGQIVEINKGLIADYIIKNLDDIKKYNISTEDVFQEGRIGLLVGIRNFDINGGSKFSTYAYYWIRQKIELYLYQNRGFMKVEPVCYNFYKRYREVSWKLKISKQSEFVTDDEILEELRNDSVLFYALEDIKKENNIKKADDLLNLINNNEKYRSYKEALLKKFNKKKLSQMELWKDLYWTKERFEIMKQIELQEKLPSLDEELFDEDGSYYEIIDDKSIESPEDYSDREYKKAELNKLFNKYVNIDSKFYRTLDIIKLRNGIFDDFANERIERAKERVGEKVFGDVDLDGLTINQVSYIYHMTAENARRCECTGIRQLQLLAKNRAYLDLKENSVFKFLSLDLILKRGELKFIEYSDYDPEIIEVDKEKGYIKGLKIGSTSITIYNSNSGKKYKYFINIKPRKQEIYDKRKKVKKYGLH